MSADKLIAEFPHIKPVFFASPVLSKIGFQEAGEQVDTHSCPEYDNIK